jgi:hypothetical protein
MMNDERAQLTFFKTTHETACGAARDAYLRKLGAEMDRLSDELMQELYELEREYERKLKKLDAAFKDVELSLPPPKKKNKKKRKAVKSAD